MARKNLYEATDEFVTECNGKPCFSNNIILCQEHKAELLNGIYIAANIGHHNTIFIH